MAENLKPLFIPLAAEHFDAFANGTKLNMEEYRAYGTRWNHQTCPVGRRVLLSRGYGKHKRLRGVIAGVREMNFTDAPELLQESLRKLYVIPPSIIICIKIGSLEEVCAA
jgi:hypothetical protein